MISHIILGSSTAVKDDSYMTDEMSSFTPLQIYRDGQFLKSEGVQLKVMNIIVHMLSGG